jgi:hypothetical protein
MENSKDIFADPWLKKAQKAAILPDDARFACAYELNLVVDQFDEATFLRRTETTDELWIGAGKYPSARVGMPNGTATPKEFEGEELSRIGCVFAVPRKDDKLTACLKLMELFFRARIGFEWPSRFLVSGIVDQSAFNNLVGRIEHELEENRQKTLEQETEIIKVARMLGLSPQPTGTGVSYWQARCPETNHQLYINAEKNSFGCGWCKRKGSIEELRAFVKERKDL